MKNKLYFLLLTILVFTSCDVLRFSQFEVISWTPGEGYHSEPRNIVVSLDFSRNPDIASVERNFSLTGNTNQIKGTFIWDGKRMTFLPLTPLETNTDYTINLSADAHDVKGLSMDFAFESSFSTRPDNSRPVLLSCYPQMYAEIDDPRTEVHLLFSSPVPSNALYDCVSFSPSMTGSWRLEEGGKLAVFTPAEMWTQHQRYEIRISDSMSDNNGMSTGKDFVLIFTAGTDRDAPYLLHASRITKNDEIILLNPDNGYSGAANLPTENQNW